MNLFEKEIIHQSRVVKYFIMKQFLLLFLAIPFFTFGQWSQVGIDIDGRSPDGKFGESVSLSSDGNIMAVGGFNQSGYVQVFENLSGIWTQIGADINGIPGYSYFGFSVSLSSDGSKVAIGGWGANTSAGYVQIFENINGTWTQMGSDINGEATDDRSGYSVSLSSDGTVVSIGAWKNNGNGSQSGHVRIYQYSTNTWDQIGADIDGEAAQDWSGKAVSLSSDGSIVAIGAQVNWNNGGYNGHVRVFENLAGIWTQIGSDIDAESYEDRFGASVCLSSDGSILAVGAIYNDAGGLSSGHVRVYQYSVNAWTQIGVDIDGEAAYDQLGYYISLSDDGSILAIGAPYNDGNGNNSGHARVYQYSANTWTQIGADIDGEGADDYSGSVSLNGDGSILAVGASWNDGVNGADSGHVRIYNNASLSVAANSFDLQFTVYPNPSTNIFYIKGLQEKSSLIIYEMNGKEIIRVSDYFNEPIDISRFNAGIYLIKIINKKTTKTKKLIVK